MGNWPPACVWRMPHQAGPTSALLLYWRMRLSKGILHVTGGAKHDKALREPTLTSGAAPLTRAPGSPSAVGASLAALTLLGRHQTATVHFKERFRSRETGRTVFLPT